MSKRGDLRNIISEVSTRTYGNWGQFWTLTKLNLAIQGTPEGQPSKIYANSRNMVEVIITIEILDKNNNDLSVTDDEIKSQLYFCRSETGEDLASIWLISDNPSEYVNGASVFKAKSVDKNRFIRKYISCAEHGLDQITENISVGINVPGFGKFDTSRYGTDTNMESGGPFKSPKAYQVTAQRAIDYGLKNNIEIKGGEFVTIESKLKWVSRLTTEGPLKEHWDGKCKRRIVQIRPNPSVTRQEKFKKHEIVYDAVHNSDVSKGTIYWWWGTDQNESCFSLIKQDAGYGRPGAVIGRGANCGDYQLNLWYSRRNHVGINGKFHTVDGSYFYRFNDNGKTIEKNHIDEDENGAATLVLYKFIMPENNTYQWKWEDCIRTFTVNVTDFYGNEGSFQLLFNDTDKFDEPGQV